MDIKSLEINGDGKLKTKKPLFNLWSGGLLEEGEWNTNSFYLLSRVCNFLTRALGCDCLWQQWPWLCLLQAFFVLLHPDPLLSSPSSPTDSTEMMTRKKYPWFFHTVLPPACHMLLLTSHLIALVKFYSTHFYRQGTET